MPARTLMVLRHPRGALSSAHIEGRRTGPHVESPLSIQTAANQIAPAMSAHPRTASRGSRIDLDKVVSLALAAYSGTTLQPPLMITSSSLTMAL
jgi:hypothetical protein